MSKEGKIHSLSLLTKRELFFAGKKKGAERAIHPRAFIDAHASSPRIKNVLPRI